MTNLMWLRTAMQRVINEVTAKLSQFATEQTMFPGHRVCYNNSMTPKWLVLFFLSLYTFGTACILVWSDASFLVVTALLFGGPIFVLWNRLNLQSHIVPLVAVFTLLATALVQLYAYKSGLWYEISPLSLKGFGGVPLETYLFSVLQILYLVLLYEYFFDDGLSVKKFKTPARSVALVSVLYALILGMVLSHPVLLVKYPFAFLLAFISSLFALIILARKSLPSPRLFVKAGLFTLATFPLSLIYEWVLVENGIRLFANVNEYLMYFEWHVNILPFEELLLLLIIPFGLVVVYEMYLDDGK